jgi:hypothetical protein
MHRTSKNPIEVSTEFVAVVNIIIEIAAKCILKNFLTLKLV